MSSNKRQYHRPSRHRTFVALTDGKEIIVFPRDRRKLYNFSSALEKWFELGGRNIDEYYEIFPGLDGVLVLEIGSDVRTNAY